MSVKTIQIKNPDIFVERGVNVPGSTFKVAPFKFQPRPFVIGNSYLKQTTIDTQFQVDALESFMQEPQLPCTYAIGSDPDPDRAKYFAAFLLAHYLKMMPNTMARWHGLHEYTSMVRNDVPCSFLVITGLYPGMTAHRIERCRDLIDHYERIPKLVVIGGEDPITFFQSRLFLKPTHFYYVPSNSVNRAVEVV